MTFVNHVFISCNKASIWWILQQQLNIVVACVSDNHGISRTSVHLFNVNGLRVNALDDFNWLLYASENYSVSLKCIILIVLTFALSQNCTQLIQTIEDTGTIMREIRDLEEQVRDKLINTK